MLTFKFFQGNWEYTATKYGLRGLMRTARRSSWEQGIRINYVAPCYMKSTIRTAEHEQWLTDQGIKFGEQEDVASCMMRLACDRTINGKLSYVILAALLQIYSGSYFCTTSDDFRFIGHSLMIVPRSEAKEGFMDVDKDDYAEEGYFKQNQDTQLRIIEDKWIDGYKVRVYKA